MTKIYNNTMQLQVKEQIKILLTQEKLKLKQLAEKISQRTGKKCSPDALSHKLGRGTLTYNDTLLIAEILGYKIEFVKKEEL